MTRETRLEIANLFEALGRRLDAVESDIVATGGVVGPAAVDARTHFDKALDAFVASGTTP